MSQASIHIYLTSTHFQTNHRHEEFYIVRYPYPPHPPYNLGGNVAQLVEHRTSTPLTQVRFPGAARDFSPNFQCGLSYVCPYAPVCNRMHSHLCARERSCGPRQSSVDYGNARTPSMHCRLGSATLSQLAFPGESNPNFPWEKSHLGRYIRKMLNVKIKHTRRLFLKLQSHTK